MYQNMPFIEPLEYTETKRLEELVIAIDTSSSCSREMVQFFLEETAGMLGNQENFFKKFTVYLIQCDSFIQDVVLITSMEEWKHRNVKTKEKTKASQRIDLFFRWRWDFSESGTGL